MRHTGHWTIPDDVEIQEIEERHDLSQQIFFRREEMGLSQTQLAERAGLTQAQVARLEAGHSNPTLKTLTKLAHSFGCRVAEIIRPGVETVLFGGRREAIDWTSDFPLYGSFDVSYAGQADWVLGYETDWLPRIRFESGVLEEAEEYESEEGYTPSPSPLAA